MSRMLFVTLQHWADVQILIQILDSWVAVCVCAQGSAVLCVCCANIWALRSPDVLPSLLGFQLICNQQEHDTPLLKLNLTNRQSATTSHHSGPHCFSTTLDDLNLFNVPQIHCEDHLVV